MESGFKSEETFVPSPDWQPIIHHASGRFEFFLVRHYGALHFVKRPAPDYRHDLLTTESLKKEFHLGYRLTHPAIVRYMKMEEGAVYEEYVDGLSLREMIDSDDSRLHSPDFISRLCRQLLDATAYLHSRGIVHNDIKPENVMVARIGDQLKLVDLGAATSDMWDATEGFTPGYKAPEQGTNPTNVHTDIYLIGKLMQELAPRAGAERQWKKFIAKATAENPSDRFQSDAEAVAAIPAVNRPSKWPFILIAMLIIVGGAMWLIWNRYDKEVTSDSDKAKATAKAETPTDSVPPTDYTIIPTEPSQEPVPNPDTQKAESPSAENPAAPTNLTATESKDSEFKADKTSEAAEKITPYYNSRDESTIPGEKIPLYIEDGPYFDERDGFAFLWFLNHLQYPANAKKKGIQGSVVVEIVIEKDGSVTYPFIRKGIDPELDEEALRLVRTMPKWHPAKLEGQPVRSTELVEVYFGLPKD